ncbi:hypothetical protein [uncultured Vibrio sp.]|uniref:hypothetical protein n=1 Tax=uncultured Vibrio sp. TaxID=114054 RepID=UPI0025F6140E|nr:hypothetical protein [uncultured Vibrio sp.]
MSEAKIANALKEFRSYLHSTRIDFVSFSFYPEHGEVIVDAGSAENNGCWSELIDVEHWKKFACLASEAESLVYIDTAPWGILELERKQGVIA